MIRLESESFDSLRSNFRFSALGAIPLDSPTIFRRTVPRLKPDPTLNHFSHTAAGMKNVSNISEFLDPALVSKRHGRVAAFDGEKGDPVNVRPMGDGILVEVLRCDELPILLD